MVEIYEALKANKTIKELNTVGIATVCHKHFVFIRICTGNNTSAESSKTLAAALKVNNTLETLSKTTTINAVSI